MSPVMTEEPQHMQALALANHKRLKRAAVKREVRDGGVSVVDLVENYPEELDTMPVFDILVCINRWGKTRARKFLNTYAISDRRTFAQLSERQRRMLVEELRYRGVA